MAAPQLKTVQDLLLSPDERVELISGEIVRRPMTRARHARAKAKSTGNRALSTMEEAGRLVDPDRDQRGLRGARMSLPRHRWLV